MRQVNLMVILLLLCYSVKGQFYTVEGKIVDENQEEIEFGEIIFLSTSDSSQRATIISEGLFRLEHVEKGEYRMTIISLGYQTVEKNLTITSDLALLETMETANFKLADVTLTARNKAVTFKDGNLLINVGESVLKNEVSPTSLLSRLPGIIVSPNGEGISLIGRGQPLLYIDRRRITMEEFNALQVSQIDKIEIIYHPPARYEANGQSVVVIFLKDQLEDGYRLSANYYIAKRRRLNHYSSIGGAIRKGKWEINGNLNYNHLGYWEGISSAFTVPNQHFDLKTDALSTGLRQTFTGNVGLFREIDERSSLTANVVFTSTQSDAPMISESFIKDSTEMLAVLTDDEGSGRRHFVTLNTNYTKSYEAINSELFIGLQNSQYYRASEASIHNTVSNDRLFEQSRNQDYLVNAHSLRIDFEKRISDVQSFEIGSNLLISGAKGHSVFQDRGEPLPIDILYNYNERNIAFYAEYQTKIKAANLSLGLRNEYAVYRGQAADELNPRVDAAANNLFPHLEFSCPIDSSQSISIQFSSSISRPNYLNASLISTYINPYLEYSRNPNLLPSPRRFLRFNYERSQTSFYVELFNRQNVVQQFIEFDASMRQLRQRPENFNVERGINLGWNSSFELGIWSFSNAVIANYVELLDPLGQSSQVRPYLYLYSNHNFDLYRGFFINLNAWWISARSSGIFENNSMIVVGGQISKTHENWVFSLTLSDLFRQLNFLSIAEFRGVTFKNTGYADVQGISVGVRYQIQKSYSSRYRIQEVDRNIERMR